MDEFNKSFNENSLPGEFRQVLQPDYFENKALTNPDPIEYGKAPRKAKGKSKKKLSGLSLTGIMTALAAVSVVAVSTVGGQPGIAAAMESVYCSDTYISYYAVVEETEEPVRVVLYNDFTRRVCDIYPGGYEGVFEDLQPDMSYNILIETDTSLGRKTLYESKVRTLPLIPEPITKWNNVSYEYKDGYLHFTMDFIDENFYWRDFYAELYDDYGNFGYVEITEPHAPQVIDVAGSGIIGNTATFIIYCQSAIAENTDGVEILFEEIIQL